jgi:hypothetical protein
VFASAQQTWKVAVYRLVSPPRMKSEGPVYREKLHSVYKERLQRGDSPKPRVLEIREIIESGRLEKPHRRSLTLAGPEGGASN